MTARKVAWDFMAEINFHRRMEEQEISAILALAKTVEAADGHKALEDHTWLDLTQGGRKGTTGILAQPKRGPLLGYAQIAHTGHSWSIELLIHPSERHHGSRVGSQLLEEAIAEIADNGGGHLHMWIAKANDFYERVALEAGMQRGRDLLQLRTSLPVATDRLGLGDGLRSFVPGMDEEHWLDVNNRAFSWHPEQGDWTLDTLRAREAEPWFDPAGFLLYELEDHVAAFCWTKIHDGEDPPIGEIYVIGTAPEYQGRGLGRAMCLAGLSYLHGRGLTKSMLYVDAENTAARALYKGLGFELDHLDRAYTKDVVPSAP